MDAGGIMSCNSAVYFVIVEMNDKTFDVIYLQIPHLMLQLLCEAFTSKSTSSSRSIFIYGLLVLSWPMVHPSWKSLQ